MLTISREPDPTAKDARLLVTYTLAIYFFEDSPGDVWERIQQGQERLNAPEGTLIIEDDRNKRIVKQVRRLGDSTPEPIARGKGVLEFKFLGWDPADLSSYVGSTARFQATGGEEVYLHHVTNWTEQIQSEHFSPQSSSRNRTTVTLRFTARLGFADLSSAREYRLEGLTTDQEALLAPLRAKEGRLIFGAFDKQLILENVSPKIDDDAEYLEVTIQARYLITPDEDWATADYTAKRSTSCSTGEIRTSVSGTIDGIDRDAAQAKFEEIRAQFTTGTNRLVTEELDDRWAQGDDRKIDDWLGLRFSLEWQDQVADFTGFDLRQTTDLEAESGKRTVTYEGSVRAPSEEAALAKIAELAAGKHSVLLRSNETLAWASDCDGSQRFVDGKFSYQYQTETAEDFFGGNLTLTTAKPMFGEWTRTLSGTINARTEAQAKAKAAAYLPEGCVLRDAREDSVTKIGEDEDPFESLTFNYTFVIGHEDTAVKYTLERVPDFDRMVETLTYNGQIWAETEAEANAALTRLTAEQGSTPPTQYRTSTSYEQLQGTGKCYLRTDFTVSYERGLSGTYGYDLIEATWTLRCIPQVKRGVIHEVLGIDQAPVTQRNLSWTVGVLEASGQCQARLAKTARDWCLAKRAKVSSLAAYGKPEISGLEEAPELSEVYQYAKRSGNGPTQHTFRFRFSARYTQGLADNGVF